VRRFGAGVRKRRFCAGVRKRRFCAGVRKRRFCVGVRKRALQRSCVKFFEMDRCARRAQGARRDALASHAVSVYTRFSQAPSVSILAVGAEALSMTPSGDALFAS
jgi:hypothetical protein